MTISMLMNEMQHVMRMAGDVPRAKRGASYHLMNIVAKLKSHYLLALEPGKTVKDFEREFASTYGSGHSGDTLTNELKRREAADEPINYRLASFVIASAYCADAFKALQRNERDLAWSYLVDAQLWSTGLKSEHLLDELELDAKKSARTETAKKGGVSKSEKRLKPLKEEAFRLAKEKISRGELWKSRRACANSILGKVNAVAGKLNLDPVKAPAVDDWLKELPKPESLFRTLRKETT